MHNIVAFPEFGEIQQLVNLRAVREHAPPRLQRRLCAPAKHLAATGEHRRARALCNFRGPDKVRRKFLYYKSVPKISIYKFKRTFYIFCSKHPARVLFVAFRFCGYKNIGSGCAPIGKPPKKT